MAAGARIERSVVGARSSVGASSTLVDLTVIGFDQDVPAGTTSSGERFPGPDAWRVETTTW